MALGITILIAAALAVFIMTPLLTAQGAGAGTLPVDVTLTSDLKRRRMVVYDNLQDLEFEFKAGKIAQEDYESLRNNYRAEAAGLMAASLEAEKGDSTDAMIEREIAARRAQRKVQAVDDYVCSKCGYENPLPVKFCGECGAALGKKKKKG